MSNKKEKKVTDTEKESITKPIIVKQNAIILNRIKSASVNLFILFYFSLQLKILKTQKKTAFRKI
jgi:hypothetical protein